MSSAGLQSFRAAIEANSLTASQQAALLEALDVVIPEFVAPDDTGATERAQRMVETWGAVLYAIDAEGAQPVPATSPRASFVMKMAVLPEPDPADSLGALATSTAEEPNQQQLPNADPTGLQDMSHVFIFPEACKLGTFRAFGSTALLATFNQRVVMQPVDLYVNGARVRTLVTIPAGDGGAPGPGQDFDLTDPGGDAFAAGDLVQFVLPIPGGSSGTLNGVLFAFDVVPA